MRKIVISVLFLVYIFLLPQNAYAHFPATDGEITVTLHVDPNDDPTPGQQAYLYFLFTDTTKRFALKNCTCTVSISEQNKTLFSKSLQQEVSKKPSIWGASTPYIFPQDDVYTITMTGKPLKTGAFQPFTLSWNFRVDTMDPGLAKPGFSDIQVLLFSWVVGIIALFLIGIFVKREFFTSEN